MLLNKLTKLVKRKKRVGRGGSRGGTSGRGHKGQKARTGDHSIGYGFEGGQMPLARRLPKRGFNNKEFARSYELVNLGDLERCYNNGDEVTKETLIAHGLISRRKSNKGPQGFLLKVLATGDFSKKLTIYADAASNAAIEGVKKAGGTIQLTKEM